MTRQVDSVAQEDKVWKKGSIINIRAKRRAIIIYNFKIPIIAIDKPKLSDWCNNFSSREEE